MTALVDVDPRELVARVLADAAAPCITSSFQAECVVLTDIVREVRPDIPVLFLDTFHHFPQTLEYRDMMTARYGLNLVVLQAKEPKLGLWEAESTTACCQRHKVEPLFSALEGYDTWLTALRRDQSASRANLQQVEPFRLSSGKMIQRVAPIAAWTAKDVWSTEGARHPAAAALRPRLRQHRLRAVHERPVRSQQSALGPLVRPEARMRDPHSGEM
jgi:phosphoadenosine phosphosulfate reductase